MAKLTTHTTERVEHRLRISRDELIAILREKFPVIPEFSFERDMTVERDGGTDLEAIVFEWKSSTSDEPVESELTAIKPACGRVCNRPPAPLAATLAEPPLFFDPDASAFDAMQPPEGRIEGIQQRESNE